MIKRLPLLLLAIVIFVAGCRYEIEQPLPTRPPAPEETASPAVRDIHMLQKSDIPLNSGSDFFKVLEDYLFLNISIDTLDSHDYDRKIQIMLNSQVEYDAISISPGMASGYLDMFIDINEDVKNYPNFYNWLKKQYNATPLIVFPVSKTRRSIDSGWFLKDGSSMNLGSYTLPGGVEGIMAHVAPLFGIPDKYLFRDGTVEFTPMSDKYRQALEWVNSLYTEGRLDPDFFVMRKSDWEYKIENNLFDITVVNFDDWDIPYKAGYKLVNPPEESGMESKILSEPQVAENYMGILKTYGDPAPILEFIDFMHSDEGNEFLNFGYNYISLDWEKNDTFSTREGGLLSPRMPGILVNEIDYLPSSIANTAKKYNTMTLPEGLLVEPTQLIGDDFLDASKLEGKILPSLQKWHKYFIEQGVSGSDWDEYKDELDELGITSYVNLITGNR